ncbi:MAG: GNAT family N-acetyltransferase [Candidatus Thorarchaeota archaeon]
MEIQTITEDNLDIIRTVCLDPSVDKKTRNLMENGMEERVKWIKKMIPKGLELLVAFEKPREEYIDYKWVGKILHSDLAVNDRVPMGLIEFLPIECALEPITGKNSLFINCMWILPPFWNQGVGKILLESFIEKAKELGSGSVISYEGDKWFGTSISYMASAFFNKFGFQEVDRDGSRVLLYLDLGSSDPPKFTFPKIKSFNKNRNINLDIFFNNQCPWARYMINTVKKGLTKYNIINCNVVDANQLDIIKENGISRGIRLNNKIIFNRMASWAEVQAAIDKFLKNSQ